MSVLVASPRARMRWRRSTVVAYALLIALAVFYLLPMFAIVVTSLKSFAEVSRSTLWELPRSPTLEAFGSAFEKRREFVEYAYPDRGPRDSKKRPSVDSILSVSLVFHLFSPIFFSLS